MLVHAEALVSEHVSRFPEMPLYLIFTDVGEFKRSIESGEYRKSTDFSEDSFENPDESESHARQYIKQKVMQMCNPFLDQEQQLKMDHNVLELDCFSQQEVNGLLSKVLERHSGLAKYGIEGRWRPPPSPRAPAGDRPASSPLT